MTGTVLTIGDRVFHLGHREDPSRLQADALHAAQAGAGFVHFTIEDGRRMDALVTAHLPVVFADPLGPIAISADDVGLSFADFDNP